MLVVPKKEVVLETKIVSKPINKTEMNMVPNIIYAL